MKIIPFMVFACSALVALHAVPARAGQFALDPMTPGVKYCPAPGADNSEFLHSYWAVDAKTGEMTKMTATDHPGIPPGYETNQQQEEVLFVAPNISVENRYVPYPGASAQQPPAAFRQPPVMAAPVQAPPPVYVHPSPTAPANHNYSPIPPPPPQQRVIPRQAARPRSAPAPRPRYRQPQPEQVSQSMASATPRTIVPDQPQETKQSQESLKKSSGKSFGKAFGKHSSKSRSGSEKQPWWRHIWRN